MVMAGPLTPPLYLHPSAQPRLVPLGRPPAQPSASSASAHSTPAPALGPPTPSLSISSYDTVPSRSPADTHPSTHIPHASTSTLPLPSPLSPALLPALAPSGNSGGFARVLGRKQSVRTVREASEVFAEAKQLYLSGVAAVERERKGKAKASLGGGSSEEGDRLASGLFRQARTVFLEIGESARVDKCTWQICMLHANRGLAEKRAARLNDALGQFAIAQEGFRAIDDPLKEGMCAFQRALCESLRRRPGEARDHLEDAIAIFELGGPSCDASLAMAHCELGHLLGHSSPLDAIENFKSAVALFRATAQPEKEARALSATGLLAARARQPQVAEFHLVLAARAWLALGDSHQHRLHHAHALYGLGKLAAHAHHLAAAVDLYSDAAAVFHAVGAGEDEGWCLYRLGLVMLKAGDGGLAVAYFNDARGVFGGEGRREEEGKCLLRIGEAMAKVEPGMAVDPLSEGLELFESVHYDAAVELCQNKLLEALDKPIKTSSRASPGKEIRLQSAVKPTDKQRKSLWTLGR